MNTCGGGIGVRVNKPIVVGDADAIIAQTNPHDVHHEKATAVSGKLKREDAQVIYPATAILEAAC